LHKRKEIELAEYVQADAAIVAVATTASIKRMRNPYPTTIGVQRGQVGSRSEGKLLSPGFMPETR
jgi:hypothetical protein